MLQTANIDLDLCNIHHRVQTQVVANMQRYGYTRLRENDVESVLRHIQANVQNIAWHKSETPIFLHALL